MTWRVASALEVLLRQVNEKFPQRSKASDGSIGNAAHATRTSDHNPWVMEGSTGIVTARDFTNDPLHGLDSEHLAEALRLSKDKRLKYVISNRKIASFDHNDFAWRPYNGANAHNHHCHVSVREHKDQYDDTSPWNLDGIVPVSVAPPGKPHVEPRPVLKLGASGEDVKKLQTKLFVSGTFDARTEAAIKELQRTHNVVEDGIVGPYTWDLLG